MFSASAAVAPGNIITATATKEERGKVQQKHFEGEMTSDRDNNAPVTGKNVVSGAEMSVSSSNTDHPTSTKQAQQEQHDSSTPSAISNIIQETNSNDLNIEKKACNAAAAASSGAPRSTLPPLPVVTANSRQESVNSVLSGSSPTASDIRAQLAATSISTVPDRTAPVRSYSNPGNPFEYSIPKASPALINDPEVSPPSGQDLILSPSTKPNLSSDIGFILPESSGAMRAPLSAGQYSTGMQGHFRTRSDPVPQDSLFQHIFRNPHSIEDSPIRAALEPLHSPQSFPGPLPLPASTSMELDLAPISGVPAGAPPTGVGAVVVVPPSPQSSDISSSNNPISHNSNSNSNSNSNNNDPPITSAPSDVSNNSTTKNPSNPNKCNTNVPALTPNIIDASTAPSASASTTASVCDSSITQNNNQPYLPNLQNQDALMLGLQQLERQQAEHEARSKIVNPNLQHRPQPPPQQQPQQLFPTTIHVQEQPHEDLAYPNPFDDFDYTHQKKFHSNMSNPQQGVMMYPVPNSNYMHGPMNVAAVAPGGQVQMNWNPNLQANIGIGNPFDTQQQQQQQANFFENLQQLEQDKEKSGKTFGKFRLTPLVSAKFLFLHYFMLTIICIYLTLLF